MKRHIAAFYIILALVVGLSAGFVLRGFFPADEPDTAAFNVVSSNSTSASASNSNFSLLITSMRVLKAIHTQDFSTLSTYADPESGVTFTPFSTVALNTNVTLSAKEIAGADSDTTDYIWGTTPSQGDPIRLNISEFFSTCLWDVDYTSASEIGIDTVLYTGNAQENIAEAYPDCRFVDFYMPGQKPDNMNWSSLKLVFLWKDSKWYLTGVVHSKWTP